MTFRYKDYFDAAPSIGYETLIYDCMIGDAILFQRADGVEAGWRIVQPFLDAWRNAGSGGTLLPSQPLNSLLSKDSLFGVGESVSGVEFEPA
jgi:glucose-6-phosphate 1-dehydrogenase